MENFAKNTRFLRKLRGLKHSQIEDSVGIKASTWNNYECGNSYPNLFGLVRIAQFFKVDEYTLLHIDISADAHLIEILKEAGQHGKAVYIPNAFSDSEVKEPALAYKHPALITEIFQRVIDLEAEMELLKQKFSKE